MYHVLIYFFSRNKQKLNNHEIILTVITIIEGVIVSRQWL